MGNASGVLVKARAVVRQLGRSEGGDPVREYTDWHIEIRAGPGFVSVWTSAGMVFHAIAGTPVFHRPGPWEQYLERLFQKTRR